MKHLTVFLLILLVNSCNKAKPLTYEAGLKNCDQALEEKRKKDPNAFSFEGPECLIGAQIPEFEAYTLEGKKINRELLKGKLTIINFWFTTCAPCVAEIPGLDAIVQKFGADKLNYIAIGRENSQDIKDFLVANPWRFEQIPDGAEISKKNFKLRWGFPTTFLLNKNAEIILAIAGGKSDSTAVEAVQRELIPVIERELKP
jgi:thiol-disulfide isomerase/thioredoxin